MAVPTPPRLLLVDTSAAIALLEDAGRTDLVELLIRAGFRLAFPEAVWREFGASPLAASVRTTPGVESFDPDPALLNRIRTTYPLLGRGELAVLARGVASPAATCVLDDKRARAAAGALGIDFTGTLGLLEALAALQLLPVQEKEAVLRALAAAGFRMPPSA